MGQLTTQYTNKGPLNRGLFYLPTPIRNINTTNKNIPIDFI